MSEGTARRLAWTAFALGALLSVVSVFFALGTKQPPGQASGIAGQLLIGLSAAVFPVVALLILVRQPLNRIGWILMAIGLGSLENALGTYGDFAISRGLPGGALSTALSGGFWAPPIGLIGTSLILRFPNGRLLSPRWRKVEWLALAAILVVTVLLVAAPGDLDSASPNLANPIGVDALEPFMDLLFPLVLLIPITMVASAVSLVLRFRRSTGVERLQMKWLTSAAAAAAVIYLAVMVASLAAEPSGQADPTWMVIMQNIAVSSFDLIPIAIGVAILKHRLYDIDVVINKTLVYGSLAAFITAVYVAIVVGIGEAIGTSGRPNVALSIAATAVVAFAFQPVRERVQHLANRLVYGKRATPYEVLSGFAGQIAGTHATEEIGPAMARLLVDGTGARRAEIWLQTDRDLRLEATWPAGETGSPMPLPSGSLPPTDQLSTLCPVLHQGELLGYLVIRKTAGDPVTPADEKLVSDVAGHAGLILRNVRLIEDLTASRRRLVAARDEERRKLERNIHDGAQQRLVALSVLYNLAKGMADPKVEGQQEQLADLGHQAQGALETLRDLARGIYPPLLADQGLVAAIQAQSRRAALPVHVLATGIDRYPQEVEAAVYFCCLEALQNVGKYAEAGQALIRLQEENGEIQFGVEDDGKGFDRVSTPRGAGMTNMADRLAAVGGSLEVRSSPGSGTMVTGRVPIRHAALAEVRE